MRQTDRTILVTGATGQQGGAAAAALLADGWQVRALVREPAAPAAVALAAAGAQLAVGNLDDRASVDAAMRGAHGVYSVQPADEHEARRGRAVADAAAAAGVAHLVYMSTGGAERQSRVRALAKWEIEEHIRAIGVPATILRPAGFMEDVVSQRFGLHTGRFATAVDPGVRFQLIAVRDIGAFAALAFGSPTDYLGRAVEIAGDALTPGEIAAALSRAAGRDIPYAQVPMDVLREHSPGAATVFEWVNREYYTTDLAALGAAHPALTTFDTWLATDGKGRLATLFG
ncbi:NAD(P)H-binding protein [Solihabitans fulvus]|uniref:NAD(P)H-binding protein n=1 Tax=Solihabitans fulvus TaxID=1892852 RepID=A0A5B2WZR6_9PSEU|nr:NmrA family NAD(P)-binding protein [Solihabitans fulvus]KAA2255477.1 NAD(P)H-binding protein [Solihabitans fulvus]